MIVKPTTDRLYDTRNFDSQKNYYAILYNREKYQLIKDKNKADAYTIYAEYTQLKLILDVDYSKERSDSIFKVVYGHFYNDQNFFLFKQTHNGKVIGYKINKCRRAELWHNNLNQLYITNYFGDIKQTVVHLNMDVNKDIGEQTFCPALTYIEYDEADEKLNFKELYVDIYSDELLEITMDNPYTIKPK